MQQRRLTKPLSPSSNKRELIQELIMIADMDDRGFQRHTVGGVFTLQDVQEITSEINK